MSPNPIASGDFDPETVPVQVWEFPSGKACDAAYDKAARWLRGRSWTAADVIGMSTLIATDGRTSWIVGVGLERDDVPGSRFLDPPPEPVVAAYRARMRFVASHEETSPNMIELHEGRPVR